MWMRELSRNLQNSIGSRVQIAPRFLPFLYPHQIAFLGNSKAEGVMATNSRYFVYFESGSLRSERDYDTFITTVETLIANLL
jgi:hypothetical protein